MRSNSRLEAPVQFGILCRAQWKNKMSYFDRAIVSFTVVIQNNLFIVITHCQLHYRDHFPGRSKSSPN